MILIMENNSWNFLTSHIEQNLKSPCIFSTHFNLYSIVYDNRTQMKMYDTTFWFKLKEN